MKRDQYIWGILRITLGWIFLWPFFDKLFGLGFATAAGNSWLSGTSPTSGFLLHGTKGPLAFLFQSLANNPVVDWLFMLGLLLIGLSLILGIGVRIACYSGMTLLILMYLATLLPENNPIVDEHIVFSIILFGLSSLKAGQWLGFGKRWSKTKLVKKYRILE